MAEGLPGEDLLQTNPAFVAGVLEEFIRSETQRVGFHRVVVGVSGGLDSAVSAALGCRALGPKNVTGIAMPYRTSAPESAAHAQAVLTELGCQQVTVDITPMADGYLAHHPDLDNVRRGNVLSRMRMIVLFDHSLAQHALVMGTSNKSELLLGYGTIFGDMACGLNPLGDLYKTQVRVLARHLGLPEEIIRKAPTADLWVGQSDEGELGMTYADVDRLLALLLEGRRSPEEAVELGFEASFVQRVVTLMRRNQFKRRPPLIAKLSTRAIGTDFRYPRDWGV